MNELKNDPEPRQLWQRVGNYFVVEIQVGVAAWVECGRVDTEPAARKLVTETLADSAVVRARICEHDLIHTCSVVREENQTFVMRVPPKMKPTGREQDCPKCAETAPVYHDGSNEWVFCSACEQAFPTR